MNSNKTCAWNLIGTPFAGKYGSVLGTFYLLSEGEWVENGGGLGKIYGVLGGVYENFVTWEGGLWKIKENFWQLEGSLRNILEKREGV